MAERPSSKAARQHYSNSDFETLKNKCQERGISPKLGPGQRATKEDYIAALIKEKRHRKRRSEMPSAPEGSLGILGRLKRRVRLAWAKLRAVAAYLVVYLVALAAVFFFVAFLWDCFAPRTWQQIVSETIEAWMPMICIAACVLVIFTLVLVIRQGKLHKEWMDQHEACMGCVLHIYEVFHKICVGVAPQAPRSRAVSSTASETDSSEEDASDHDPRHPPTWESLGHPQGESSTNENPVPDHTSECPPHLLAGHQTDKAQLETQREASRKDQTELLAQNTDLKKQRSTFEAQISKLHHEEANLISTNRSLQAQNDQFNSQVADLQSVRTSQQTCIDALQTDQKAMGEAFTALRARYVRKTKDLFVMRYRVWTIARVRPHLSSVEGSTEFSLSHSNQSGEENVLVLQPKRDKRSLPEVDESRREPDRYLFDHVFQADATNRDVYEEVEPLIQPFLDGKDVVLMVDGHSGTGKSHTMYREADGVAMLAAQQLFRAMAVKDRHGRSCRLSCSSLEVYNGQSSDLLQEGSSINGTDKAPLGQAERQVHSAEELASLLSTAHRNRKTMSTAKNADSSRGHLVSCMTLTQGGKSGRNTSTLHLIDLAGAETNLDTATDQQKSETNVINRSRLEWHRMLIQVMEQSDPHKLLPGTRGSELPRLLQSSMKKSTKFVLIATVSAQATDHAETAATLKFAQELREGGSKPREASQRKEVPRHEGLGRGR